MEQNSSWKRHGEENFRAATKCDKCNQYKSAEEKKEKFLWHEMYYLEVYNLQYIASILKWL